MYLENRICKFTPLFSPSKKKVDCVSTCLFKMKDGYKNFDKYLVGLKHLNKYVLKKRPSLVIRVFIDSSIYKDKKIFYFLKKMKKVQLVLFKCNEFFGNGYHFSTFGTIIRFFYLFDFKNNDTRRVFICEADFDHKNIKGSTLLFREYDTLVDKNIDLDKYHIFYHGRLFHEVSKKITYGKYVKPYILASKLAGFGKKIDRNIILNFIENINNYKKLPTDYPKKRCYKNICFGIDEYFLNDILIEYLIKNRKPYLFMYNFNINSQLYFNYGQNKDTLLANEYVKYLLNGSGKKVGENIGDNLKILDEVLFGKKYYKPTISSESIFVYDRYQKLLRYLHKKGHYNFFSKEYIDIALSEKFKGHIRSKIIKSYFSGNVDDIYLVCHKIPKKYSDNVKEIKSELLV